MLTTCYEMPLDIEMVWK